MTYELEFDRRALKEWRKLDNALRLQFKKKLRELLIQPQSEANRLRELPNCYKIKLRSSGYRLIYQIQELRLVVMVVAVGKRERGKVYEDASYRI